MLASVSALLPGPLQRRSWQLWLVVGAVWALLLSGAVAAHGHLSHGVSAVWEVDRDGAYHTVAKTFEGSPVFKRDRIPLSRFLQHWDFERDGVPESLFPFRATFSGSIDLSEPAELRAVGSGKVELRVAGKVVGSSEGSAKTARIAPGRHPFTVTWRDDFRFGGRRLRVERCLATGECFPLQRAELTPRGDHQLGWRVGIWCLVVVFGAFVSWLVLRFWETSKRPRLLAAASMVALLTLHLGLRLWDYDAVPDFRENGDELFATWNGWQLLKNGETVGWSLWASAYPAGVIEVEQLHYFGLKWDLVRPYLEHPPLLHVLVGLAAHLGGASHFSHAKLQHTRLVPIGLSVVTLLLLVAVARRFDRKGAAPWIAGLLYATLPLTAIQNRVIKEEALVTPLALASIWSLLRFREFFREHGRPHHGFLIGSALLAAGCTLAKVPGFAFAVAIVALLMSDRRWRSALIASGVAVSVAGLLFVYGALIDWEAFVEASKSQGHRPTHFNMFIRWFHHGLINHNTVGRGWAIFLWLAAAAEFTRLGVVQSRVLVVPLVLYLLAITVGSGNWTFGWYMLPLYPFLCIAAGLYLCRLWREPRLFGGLLFAAVLVMYSANFVVSEPWMKAPEHWPAVRFWLSLLVAAVMTPWLAVELWPNALWIRVARIAWALLLAAQVALSGYFVVNYGEIFDSHKHFDHDVHFDR